MAPMPAGGRHSLWTQLLAVAMSLVIVLASVLAMTCHVVGEHGVTGKSAGAIQNGSGHAHADVAQMEHELVVHAHTGTPHAEEAGSCDADADRCLPETTHIGMCDFVCHSGWSFSDACNEPVVVIHTQLRFDWSAHVLVGPSSSTLDRPPKPIVHA